MAPAGRKTRSKRITKSNSSDTTSNSCDPVDKEYNQEPNIESIIFKRKQRTRGIGSIRPSIENPDSNNSKTILNNTQPLKQTSRSKLKTIEEDSEPLKKKLKVPDINNKVDKNACNSKVQDLKIVLTKCDAECISKGSQNCFENHNELNTNKQGKEKKMSKEIVERDCNEIVEENCVGNAPIVFDKIDSEIGLVEALPPIEVIGSQVTVPEEISEFNKDNSIHIKQCSCKNKIQCFGFFGDNVYTKTIYGNEGIEIKKCIKHEKNVCVGYIKFNRGSCLSGKASNNTVYFGREGRVTVTLNGTEKLVFGDDCFFIPQGCEYEIINKDSITAVLAFVKISSKIF